MLRVEASLNRKAMWENGSQARNSSSPTMPPRMLTVRVVPTPCGCGLVHVTLVIAVAQCGHDSASSSTSNTCSGVMARSTVLTNRNGACVDEVQADALAWLHGHTHARAWCLAGSVARRGEQRQPGTSLIGVARPWRRALRAITPLRMSHSSGLPCLAVGQHRRGHVLGRLREHADDLVDHLVAEVGALGPRDGEALGEIARAPARRRRRGGTCPTARPVSTMRPATALTSSLRHAAVTKSGSQLDRDIGAAQQLRQLCAPLVVGQHQPHPVRSRTQPSGCGSAENHTARAPRSTTGRTGPPVRPARRRSAARRPPCSRRTAAPTRPPRSRSGCP